MSGGDGNDTISGGDGDDFLQGEDGDDIVAGGEGDDEVRGNEGNDTVRGDAGDDLLSGQNGNDEIYGGLGNDRLYGQSGDDTLEGEEGDDRLYGGSANDTLLGGVGDDKLFGEDGDDTLYGQAGLDTLFGHAGDDLLDAGDDQIRDTLVGGAGLDQFVVLGNIGSGSLDVVTDRAGFETYNGFDGTLTALAEVEGNTLVVRGMPGDDKIQIYARDGQDRFEIRSEHQSLGTYSTTEITEVVIDSGDGDDLIDNSNRSVIAMRVNGGAGNDTIRGGRGNDDLDGGAGDDEIFGYDGDDFLRGGLGDDRLDGHNGNDRLSGNQGNDRIYGHSGNDEMNGGEGNDRAWGGSGDDFVGGNEGNDQLRGEIGNDTLRGGDGDDYLHGGSDDDTLFGEAGLDELFGGSSNDILSGGTDDEIDILWGNGGQDQFFAVRDDDVQDLVGDEPETDPVEKQSLLSVSAGSSPIEEASFQSFTQNIPEGASYYQSGGLEIVDTGIRQLSYTNSSDNEKRLVGNFPITYSSIEISNVLALSTDIASYSDVNVNGDFVISVVPISAIGGVLGTASLDYSDAIIATGANGEDVIVGGVSEFETSSGVVSRLPNILPEADLVSSTPATVSANIAGVNLGQNSKTGIGQAVTQTVLARAQEQTEEGVPAADFAQDVFQLVRHVAVEDGVDVPKQSFAEISRQTYNVSNSRFLPVVFVLLGVLPQSELEFLSR